MKKIIFILASIILVAVVSTIYLFTFDNKVTVENDTNKSSVSEDLDENIEFTDGLSIDNDKKDVTDNQKKETTTNEIESNINQNDNKNKITSNDYNDNSSSKTNNNSSKNTTNNNINKKSNSTTAIEQKESSNIIQKNDTENVKSCTPKKFDMNFVRADFDSMSKCIEIGDKYKAIGYGYFCDFYQDDCGDTYYMLTLYERNTGVEFDFHNIELPN